MENDLLLLMKCLLLEAVKPIMGNLVERALEKLVAMAGCYRSISELGSLNLVLFSGGVFFMIWIRRVCLCVRFCDNDVMRAFQTSVSVQSSVKIEFFDQKKSVTFSLMVLGLFGLIMRNTCQDMRLSD